MLQTGISTSYVPSWSMVESLREVLQEMFDARTQFGCNVSVKYRNGILVVQDDGPGIRRSDLALGQSSKRDNDRLIGQFGEGLKLAALVAARNDRKFYIDTNEFSTAALITRSSELGCDVLTFDFDIPRRRRPSNGTKITVECTNEEYNEAKKFFLELDKQKLKTLYTFEYNGSTILTPGGKVYINGAAAAEYDNLLFSYNISGVKTVQNRDRNIVNIYDLQEAITILLEMADNPYVPNKYFRAAKTRGDYFELNLYIRPEDINLWHDEFFKVYGANTCRSDTPMADLEARRAGFKPLQQIYYYNFNNIMDYIGIPSSSDLVGQIKQTVKKEARLNKKESAVLRQAVDIIRNVWRDPGHIKVVNQLELTAGMNYVNNEGIYDCNEGCIYLNRNVLNSLPKTVGVLIHEALHRYSGYRDCTREYEEAWKDLVIHILEKYGHFDY